MNAADQQVNAEFTSLNLFQAVIRPNGWQHSAKRQLSASLAGVLGWGSMIETLPRRNAALLE
jgi:hypothetical protein